MIEALKPYVEYKESGVPWLGKVPMHWRLERLGALGKFSASGIDKKTVAGEPQVRMINYLDIYKNPTHELWANRQLMVVSCPEEKKHDHAAKQGDMFFTPSSETSDDIGWSAVAMEDLPVTVYSYHVIRFRSHVSIDLLYCRYWCNNTFVLNQFSRASRGTTRKILDRCDFRRIIVVLPPGDEQAAIGRFLDHTNHKIDRFIRTKQRLIKLLNEKKQTIIYRAVTRGLDPNVQLKPSGIDWLSEIPENWFSVRAGTLASSLQTGPFGSQLHAHDYTPNGIPVINPSHMAKGRIVADPNCAIDLNKAIELSRHRLHPGDIIFARRGELGRCALVGKREEGWLCGTGSLRMRLKDDVADPEYLMQLFLSKGVAEWLSLQSVGSTMDNLNTGIFARLPLPLPPKYEQRAIFLHLNKQQSLVDSAIDRAQREITLLREYRTRLISDVVTGKFDVRGVVIPAMDKAETLEDIDTGEESELESELIESDEVADADE